MTDWLNIIPKDLFNIIVAKCDDGAITIMKYVSIEIRTKCLCNHSLINFNICDYGAFCGNVDIIKFGIEVGFKCTIKTANTAAAQGHFDVCKFLHSLSCKFSIDICTHAVRGGNKDILLWLWENGYAWSTNMCSCAAAMGNLQMIQWLRANGCDWDKKNLRLMYPLRAL
jgi:hypothetical protein